MNYRQQDHFTKDYKTQGLSAVTNQLRGTQKPQNTKELKGTRGCMLKHFAFCYNNRCPVYKKAKQSTSYWPQKPESEKLREIEEANRLQELDKDPTATFSPETAKKLIMQEYNKATSNTKNQETSRKYWKELGWRDSTSIKRLYKQKDHSSLYNWDPEEETFSDIEDIKIIKYIKQAKKVIAKIAKLKIIINDLFTD